MKPIRMIFESWLLVPLIGLYLALQLAFNKGFSYAHVWVGPFPLFVTEGLLGLIAIAAVWGIFSDKREVLFESKSFLLLAVMYGCVFVLALWRISELRGPDLLQSLKRFALWYYMAASFLLLMALRDSTSRRRLLMWLYVGCLIRTMANLYERFAPLPAGWPTSVGIAELTASIFAFYYAFIFSHGSDKAVFHRYAAALAMVILVTTGIRTASVGVFLSFIVFLGAAHRTGFWSEFSWKVWLGPSVLMLLLIGLIFNQKGTQTAFSRMQRDIISMPPVMPLSARPPVTSAKSKAVSPLVKTLKEPKVHVPTPSIPNTPNDAFLDEIAAHDSVPILEKSAHKPLQTVTKRVSAAVVPAPISTRHQWPMAHFSGNILWRLLVWQEALTKTFRYHPILGYGPIKPLIAESVTPYLSQERRRKAAELLYKRYSFHDRLTNSTRRPSDNIPADYPIPMTYEEQQRTFYSTHWYDIDPHNSHVAILYRYGLLGFFVYAAWLLWIAKQNWIMAKEGSRESLWFLSAFAWILSAASLNVVLEGPFLGATFWILAGVSMISTSLLRKGPYEY